MNKENIIASKSDPLSYATILMDRNNFRKSGTRSGSEFNYFDTPRQTYFKILFYFCNGDADGNINNNTGLLAPSWINTNNQEYYNYNSAWGYLKMNAEDDRADKLEKFITLLSNISSDAPWTFTSISGLDQALERQVAGQNKEFKVDEERKKITIKCLPDSFDERIGTLLDLYREIVWDWESKREMVPANLRKFDMAIFLFSDPIKNIHTPKEGEEAHLNSSTNYLTSSKYIEFHNCEFEYNSSKSPYGEMNNAEGNQLEYTIDINYDDAYECRWNEFIMEQIGDTIVQDIANATDQEQTLKSRVDMYKLNGFLANATNELIGTGKSYLENKLKSAYLGNLYTASIPRLIDQVKGAVKGQVVSTVSAIDDYVEHMQRRDNKSINKDKLFETPAPKTINQNLGNLFKGNSMAKNI